MLINSAYLLGVDIRQRLSDSSAESVAFQYVFASHLLVGTAMAVVLLGFLGSHLSKIRLHGNKKAKRRGIALAVVSVILAATGFLLVRAPGLETVIGGTSRSVIYLVHVFLPVITVLLFVRHRAAASVPLSRRLRNTTLVIGVVGLVAIVPLLAVTADSGFDGNVQSYAPSLLKLSGHEGFDAAALMRDDYCAGCHADTHARWQKSAHRNSSFNNPFYAAAVHRTRERVAARDGNTHAARFCAGCHDPVPLVSGEFDRVDFGGNDFDSAEAGITCTVCHSITSIDSPRGNADFTITPPEHYPFAFSSNKSLKWLSDVLVRSNPDFHKRTFLKPLHKTAEFCGTCHKVHIPESLNNYRWLRGQNHYDSFMQSGVSGHKIDSFHYPPKAENSCNGCHMENLPSSDIGASMRAGSEVPSVRDHLFAAGNTALPFILEPSPGAVIREHEKVLQESVTLDIVGFRQDGIVGGEFIPAHRFHEVAATGQIYLLELVIRTRNVGHAFTQGTADSNQVWVDLSQYSGGKLIAQSGGLDANGDLDEFATHTIRNYVVDKDGQRVRFRNVEDIHTTVYSRQIPPGAAEVVHYRFRMPDSRANDLEFIARLRYRKFDSRFRRYSLPASGHENDLPIIDITEEQYRTVDQGEGLEPDQSALNDYGIGLFRKTGRSQFRAAEEIFRQLADEDYAPGKLNLVRLLLAEGRVDEAASVVESIDVTSLDNPWTAVWFTALIDLQNGFFEEAIRKIEKLIVEPPGRADSSGFDFSTDYHLLETLANALVTQSRRRHLSDEESARLLARARLVFEALLKLEPEWAPAHQGMLRIATLQGDSKKADLHRALHQRYRPDEHAESRSASKALETVVGLDRLTSSIVIYDLYMGKNK